MSCREERRRLQREKRQTLKELRDYQWQQNAWNAGEQMLAARKVQMQTDEEISWGEDLKSHVKQKQAEAAAEKLLQAMAAAARYGSEEKADLWESHEKKWKVFEEKETKEVDVVVSYHDIPWPPATTGILSAMAVVELENAKCLEGHHGEMKGMVFGEKEAYIAHKRAFRKAQMRWHPDKFIHRFSKILDKKDASRIEQKINEISSSINEEWLTLT